MDSVSGIVLLMLCFWCSGGLFYGIGVFAGRKNEPVNFYSGTKIPAETVCDIPAYNTAVSKMWKRFGAAYFLAGLFCAAGFWHPLTKVVMIFFLGMIVPCNVLGICWLVSAYEKIRKRHCQGVAHEI